jgi:plastocyanin
MKGARALASGMLVLGLCCAIPAISAAQEAGTTTDATTTTATAPEPANPTVSPTPPDAPPEGASAGDLSPPREESAVRPSTGGGSVGVPAAAPSADTSGGSPKAHKSASATVTMGDFFFSPASVSVAVGDTVTWRNTGQAPHNAIADDGSFSTPDLNQGQSASETFTKAGTFSYICTIHPQMKGTVRVLSSGGGGGGGGGGAGSSPSESATSEASAVASPDAAGDANTLPMTGMAAGALALVGFALLALGLLIRQADPKRSRRRWLPIF